MGEAGTAGRRPDDHHHGANPLGCPVGAVRGQLPGTAAGPLAGRPQERRTAVAGVHSKKSPDLVSRTARGICEGRSMPWFDAIAIAVAFIAMAALVVVLVRGER